MQNIVIDMCKKLHNDRLRNDRALVLCKSDNNNPKKKNNNKNNVGSAWGPVSQSKKLPRGLRMMSRWTTSTKVLYYFTIYCRVESLNFVKF